MLGRLVHRSLARRPIPPTIPSRRALATQRNPWLSDKSLYPLLAITGVTVAVGAWFGPWWLHKSPEIQTPMRRRTTGQITHKKPYESIPMKKSLYEEAQDLTKDIYRVTIKDEEGSKGGKEMGKRTEGK